jgi:hypothetical protein
MANNNKRTVDLPFFELCNQLPSATTALAGMTTYELGTDRFIYYFAGGLFYRYDTIADTHQQLATPVTAPVTLLNLRYTRFRGYHGRVISATSTTVTIPGLRGPALDGSTIKIISGTGQGQSRVLTYVDETINDAGVITGTTTSTLADSTKKWRTNQWAGYSVGITFGTNATQYKKILYNDATTLYIADPNLQPHDPWNNQVYAASAPYAVPVTTAGLQAHYVITSSTYSLNSTWSVTPNTTSFFTTTTGGVYLLSSAAGAPFFTLQYYDIVNDSWQTKTCNQGLVLAALGTDVSLERTAKVGIALTTNIGTISGSNRTLVDSTQALTPDSLSNYRVEIVGGTGVGQNRRIVGHTTNTYTITRNWDTNPDGTSQYQVWPDYNRMYLSGNGNATLLAYDTENDYWMQGQSFDDGVTCNISATQPGFNPFGVTSGAIIAAGIRSINTTPTAAGSGYAIGDVLTSAVGGAGAQFRVTAITPTGGVSTLQLIHSGTTTGYTVGTGRATTNVLGSGTGCTVEFTAVGETCLVTTATAHWLRAGESVTFAGCTNASWNTSYTVLGVPYFTAAQPTTFCIVSNVAASMAATASQSTTVIVDPTKNWVVNEHVGRLVQLSVAGTSPTTQIRWITANTANTLTVATIVAAGNGTSKYSIYDSKIFGIDEQRRESDKKSYGYATGGSATTLIDSTKNWIPNQWAGYLFKVETGTGYGSGRISIISNTETTLTFATQSFTPNSTTKYEIADAWGLLTAGGTAAALNITETTTKNWTVNQWAGKRVRYLAGTNLGTEGAIVSNTATAITTAAAYTTDTTTAYAILGIPVRSTGTQLIWAWDSTTNRARFMYSPRGGGSNTLDVYDITLGRWSFGIQLNPQTELFNTGSSYTYHTGDKIFVTRSVANGVVRIFELDVSTYQLVGRATTTTQQGALHIGNFLEVVASSDGVYDYLYTMHNTSTLMVRALMF